MEFRKNQFDQSRSESGPQRPPSPLLVVDDEEANRDMLSRRLQRAGYAVEVAAGGQEALDRIRDHQVDLVLLDIMMPGMSGIEMLKLLRATYSPDELPVIMVTAISERDGLVEALNLGANDYVVKPVDFPVVKARIESQLRRKRAEQDLRRSEERYALAAQGANDGLWHWDLETGRVYYSPRWKEIVGFEDSEIGDRPDEWLGRIHADDRPEVEAQLADLWSRPDEAKFYSEHRLRHKNGAFRWVLGRAGLMHSRDGKAIRMSGSLTDITDSKTLDPLTGLANRALIVEWLERALAGVRRNAHRTFAALFVDLDHFKVINDSLGHLTGDQLLIHVGRRLRQAVRDPGKGRELDTVGRFGGDEFVILIDHVGSAEAAEAVAGRLLEALRKPFTLEGKEAFITASAGIALGGAHYQSAAEILRDADTAMYRAKTLGRDRPVVFDSEMRQQALLRLELEQDLRRAIERNQLVVFYQPKVSLLDGKLAGFEALLRWLHPTRGLIPPAEFIPLAEDSGLIVPIGLWVLRESCGAMARWHAEFDVQPPLEISVNVSVRQLRQADFAEQVVSLLRETGLRPASLHLEVTESIVLEDTQSTVRVLSGLKALGIGLKIDDFGTGYSSLKYLNDYPFNSLKIDRSFVSRLGRDENSSEVVKAILAMAKTMNLEVIAEGVETEEQLSYLKTAGCRFGQGYLFARPMPREDAQAYLIRALSAA